MEDRIEQHFIKERIHHLEQLSALLRIPSISALSTHKSDMVQAANWIAESLREAGLEHVKVMPTKGNPVVYADFLHAKDKPTVLIYGHYDVQPVDPVELWENDPFDPTIREGKIYARGASDDKGQVFMHIKALEAILKTKKELSVNVKFCIEGEEEIGSPHLPEFVSEYKDLLSADVLLISDTTMLGPNAPAICYGLRGLCALQIDVQAAKSDLHSGLYGGAVPNALHALVELLAGLHTKDGKVAVAGFYDDVEPLTTEEREALAALPHDDETYRKQLGLSALFGEPGYSTVERFMARPTLEINGVYGGFQGEGTKTVIPAQAHAKITCRLVNHQDPQHILDLIEEHVRTHTPEGVTIQVTRFDTGRPFVTRFDAPAIQSAAVAYEAGYGVKPYYMRMGGSIPIVEVFDRILHVPIVLMGFGLPDENFHAPNEHFSLENFDKGLRTLTYYYEHLETV
ncbi:dipeptidase [Sulfoacidibacillus thermotolerans]|uniref:Peptidase M20 n=1 Tax=Sulfoacidibacillus thermotolerans TaxID=1765684 RepID=A0A2U3DAM5_SULT2|nr:dipeptidase [Sulfoacidibacillus thermotolerans]PWI58303.1 peptidase M20 [Sulfoacidibacillus thermotolerans]